MQSPVFLVNSRLCLVSAALPGFNTQRAPLLPKLRGQLAEFLNDSSPVHLSLLNSSTCVGFGYGHPELSLEVFPGSIASMPSPSSLTAPHQASSLCRTGLPILQTAPLNWHPSASTPSFLRHSFVQSCSRRDRISNLLSIGVSSRITLRPRLTLGGSTFPRNPWTFGEYDSCILLVTHADILSSIQFTQPFSYASSRIQRSPTVTFARTLSFGVMFSPQYFRRDNPRPVSCYALFKGWLLLSQPPGCPGIITSLLHLT